MSSETNSQTLELAPALVSKLSGAIEYEEFPKYEGKLLILYLADSDQSLGAISTNAEQVELHIALVELFNAIKAKRRF